MHQEYYSDKQLAVRFSISRATVWRWVRQEKLPTPVQLSPGCTRWRFSEVEEWELKREAA